MTPEKQSPGILSEKPMTDEEIRAISKKIDLEIIKCLNSPEFKKQNEEIMKEIQQSLEEKNNPPQKKMTHYRILSWNCCMNFRSKFEKIVAFYNPDILIIPECETPANTNPNKADEYKKIQRVCSKLSVGTRTDRQKRSRYFCKTGNHS